jgi:hypothetical protein
MLSGFVGCHPSGGYLLDCGVPEDDGDGGEPGGREPAVEIAGLLAASDESLEPFHDWLVAVMLVLGVHLHGGRVQQERVALDCLPPHSQESLQRGDGRSVIEIGGVHGRHDLFGDVIDGGPEQPLPRGIVRVDGRAGHPGSVRDLLDARLGSDTSGPL